MKRRDFIRSGAAASVALVSTRSMAQLSSATILVGFPPGSGVTDVLARLLAEKMKGSYASSMVVENRPGVGGQRAVVGLKGAPTNGSVLLAAPTSNMSIHPLIYSNIAYDPINDVLPVGICVTTDIVIAIGPMVPKEVNDIGRLMQWYKENPSKASFATSATGTKLHFAGIKLGMEAGVPLTHIGYNSTANVTDVAGGTVSAVITTVAGMLPFASRVRVISTMGRQRSRFLPEVPTLIEGGFPSMVVTETVGLYLPAKTSDSLVQRAHEAMVKALATEEAQKIMTTSGVDITPTSGTETVAQIKSEIAEWGPRIKQIGFRQE